MAKQLNVNLTFTANTEQAKQQLQQLQQDLSKLSLTMGTGKKLGFTKEIQEATTAAAQLQVQLKEATNVSTGKLDLGKFNESLSKSGMSLAKYQKQLSKLGPEGSRAFAQLAQSITNAEIPLRRAGTLASSLWTTLKNTARWQISSSLLRGFMGAVSTAYGYAKDLNESLNNIRIVTGVSAEEMDRFAEKANKAAKMLNTTTTAYTDAALIYYQQGLSGEAVEKRVDTTVKLANITKESSETVSEWMTAIWNNFDDGSKSLEHYADVLTKLGADTASSADEIAGGLEKFAAVSRTVGLDYENAAAALATITATTRQSEDVVGTALKTIFARIESLNLGETLEDGTTLGKYSESLMKVGVNIKEQNGSLKDMNQIIEETGQKWKTLNKDEQIALAQNVAGIRQYNQFIALMDHYDFYKENLENAKNATGALNEQNEIYAESWEASSKRVQASLEGIYSSLINDDFFIDLNNFFADFFEIIDNTIDSLGGLKGVLLLLGTVITQVFQKQIAASLGNLAYNLKMSTNAGRESLIEMKREANKQLVRKNFDQDTTSSRAAGIGYETQGNAQIEYINNAERMSQEEQQISQHLLDRIRLMSELVAKSGEELEKAEDVSAELQRQLSLKQDITEATRTKVSEASQQGRQTGNINSADSIMFNQAKNIDFGETDAKKAQISIQGLKQTVNSLRQGYDACGVELKTAFGTPAATAFNNLQKELNETDINLENIHRAWIEWTQIVGDSIGNFDQVFDGLIADGSLTKEQAEQLKAAFLEVGQTEGELAAQTGKLNTMGERLKKFFRDAKGEAMSMSTAITQIASALMSFGMIVSSITGLINTWKDSEASLTDKLSATAMSLGMLIPSLVSVVKGFKNAGNTVTIFGIKTSLAMWQITLIVLAIGAVITAFVAMGQAAEKNSPVNQLKKAKEEAQALEEELKKTAQAAEDLKNNFDKYDEIQKQLKKCTEGSKEWNELLTDNNNKVIEMLNLYPELVEYIKKNPINGVLEISDEGYDIIQNQYNEKALIQQASAYKKRQEVRNREVAVNSETANKLSTGYAEATGRHTSANVWRSSFDDFIATHGGDLLKPTEELKIIIEDFIKTRNLVNPDNEYGQTTLTNEVNTYITEIQKLRSELEVNSDKINENTKVAELETQAIVDQALSGNDLYEDNPNQELMQFGARKNYEIEYEKLKKAYADGGSDKITDAKAQEEYAKIMGYTVKKNQAGNKAQYITETGEIITRDDSVAREAYAQKQALENLKTGVSDTDVKVKQFVKTEKELAEQFKNSNMDNAAYEEYTKGLQEAQKAINMTDEELKSYITTQGNATEEIKKYNAAQGMADWKEIKILNQDSAFNITQFVNGLTEGMSAEQLQIVLDVIAESESLSEFSREIEAAMNEGALKGIQSAATEVEGIMSTSIENNGISNTDVQTLLANENFQTFLQEKEITDLQFTQEHYSNKLSIISEYYAQMKALEGEQLQTNKSNYEEDLIAYQAVLDARKAEDNKVKEEIANNSGINLELYADMDVTEIETKMDEIQNRIDELNGQQIKLDMEWESTDAIEAGIKKISEFAKFVDKDMKKVGNSYQVTAASAREMAEVYPEIFAEAKVTTDGLIELNVDEVNGFINGQEAKSDAAIEANKANIESRISELEAEKEAMQADLEIAKAMAEGEMKLDGASKEYLQETRANLTQFYIDSGVDEVNANKLALETMGYNEEEYSEVVANATSRNAKNQAEGAQHGANKTVEVLKSLRERFTSFFSGIGKGWKLLLEGKFKEAWAAVVEGAQSTKEVSVNTDIDLDAYDSEGKFKGVDQAKRTAVMKEVGQQNLNAITQNIADIDKRIGNMKAELAYNDALQNQDLSNYGEKSVDNITDKDNNGSGSKSVEDMVENAERYHEITREIEAQERALTNLGKAKDRAFGDKKLKLIQQEINELDKLEKSQQDLIDAQLTFLALDKAEVEKNFQNAQFDENGNISNYSELQQAAINELNKAKEKYNKSAQEESDKKALEDAEALYEQKINSLEQYEETLDEFNKAVDDQAETAREKLDKQLEGIQYVVDVQLNLNERQIAALERLLKFLDDDLYDGAERIANMTKQMDEHFENIKVNQAGIKTTLASAGASDEAIEAYMNGDSSAIAGLDLKDEQMQMLQDYTDGIIESEGAILELRDEIENQTMTTFDAWHEKIEKNALAFEHATTMAESYKNIIDIVGKKRLGLVDNAVLEDLEYTQMEAAKGNMANAKTQMDTTQADLNKAKEELENAKKRGTKKMVKDKDTGEMVETWSNQDDIDKWEKEIETLNETLMEDQEAFMESWESSLQTAADIFTAQMDRAFEKLESDLAGSFKSFDELSKAMDKQKQVSDRFLDAGERQYELSKLNRQLQKNLDSTDSARARKELLKLQSEIEEYQKTGAEMSEMDLKALQKKYDLKVAEIALEEAQNAKSQVRLQRDSEGNFGYVYTADQNNVANAQQKYEDELEANRQLGIEQSEQLSEAIIANRQAMVEALREIRQEDYESTEKYQEALEKVTKFYTEQEAYLIGETQKVILRNQEIYDEDYKNYDGWAVDTLNRSGEHYSEMATQQQTAYDTMGTNTDGWVDNQTALMDALGLNMLEGISKGGKEGTAGTEGISAILGNKNDEKTFFGQTYKAAGTWEDAVSELMKEAGISFGQVTDGANKNLNGEKGASSELTTFKDSVLSALYGEGGSKDKPTDNSINGATKAAKNQISSLGKTAVAKYEAVATAVTTWQKKYTPKINKAKTATTNLSDAINGLISKNIEVIATVTGSDDVSTLKTLIEGLSDKTVNIKNVVTTEYQTTGDNSAGAGSGDNSNTTGSGNGKAEIGDTVTINSSEWWYADSAGGGATGHSKTDGRKVVINRTNPGAAYPYHIRLTDAEGGGDLGWVKLDQISGYDTGGYTGEWGPDGRLALLHQKEIVLNAHDTENLLTAVSMIREISAQLESNALAMRYLTTVGNYNAALKTTGDILQQEVHITAEFPNATDHNEIEEAFRNLNNLASQYANRK